MSYKAFTERVTKLATIAGKPCRVFKDDEGRYVAFIDGVRFSTSALSHKITVRYGDHHQMMFE